MFNFIISVLCSVPENAVWFIVGALGAFLAVTLYGLARCLVLCIREHIEVSREDAEEEA